MPCNKKDCKHRNPFGACESYTGACIYEGVSKSKKGLCQEPPPAYEEDDSEKISVAINPSEFFQSDRDKKAKDRPWKIREEKKKVHNGDE